MVYTLASGGLGTRKRFRNYTLTVNILHEKKTLNSHSPAPARHDNFLLPHMGRFWQLINEARHGSGISTLVVMCDSLVEGSTGECPNEFRYRMIHLVSCGRCVSNKEHVEKL